MYSLDHVATFCSPAFAALLECRKRSFTQMLLLLYEMCGTYQTNLTATETQYEVKPICSHAALEKFAQTNTYLYGSKALMKALDYLSDNSASPFESKLSLLLGLPHRYGGYGLGVPTMNYCVEATKEARAISGRSRFYCDLAWPTKKVDVEYQSKEHHEGRSARLSDSRRVHALASLGWKVIEITDTEIFNGHDMDVIARNIALALGIQKRTYIKDLKKRREALRHQLSL